PRRLDGHADPFGDNRVCFARCVANHVHSLHPERSNPRPDRPGRQPRTIERSTRKRVTNPEARRLNVRQYGGACACRLTGMPPRATTLFERVPANAAREADAVLTGLHHSAISG